MPVLVAPPGISFRPAEEQDEAFLYQVYASTRQDEMAQLADWSTEQKEAFLHMQFTAQDRYYHEQFPQAEYLVILRQGQPIGRLYLDYRVEEIGIIDIALLPEQRGQGTGTLILKDILSQGHQRRQPVRIYVEVNNPALHLYRRLGFREIGNYGIYLRMEAADVEQQ